MREIEARHRSGRPRGTPPENTIFGWIALGIEIHIPSRLFRRGFAKIEKCSFPVGEAHQHKSASAKVPG
jgi:hypothetical protein